MDAGKVFYVGTEEEVEHHARPLMMRMPITIATPEIVRREANPGDVAVFFSEHFERFRTAVRDLKRRRVATLYAIDGILEWRNAWENRPDEPACPWAMRSVLCHKVACIGSSQARTLSAWGNSGKVEVVGIPRFDGLRQSAVSDDRSDSPFRLLIMTAKWPGFTESQRRQITQSLMDLKEWCEQAGTVGGRPIELIWRLTGGLDRVIGVQNQLHNTTGEDLVATLRRVDVAITTPSTAQLESMLLGKPTAILDYTNSPLYVGAAWRITAKCQIESTMRQLFDPSAKRMHFQDCVLEDSLQLQEEATGRMHGLVQTMSEEAGRQVRQDEPIQFRQHLLPQLFVQSKQLCHDAVFPQIKLLGDRDNTDLQLELADAQREIQQLHATVDGLRSELAQSHSVFDAIRSHPIAGAVVRTREKFLHWVRRSPVDPANSN